MTLAIRPRATESVHVDSKGRGWASTPTRCCRGFSTSCPRPARPKELRQRACGWAPRGGGGARFRVGAERAALPRGGDPRARHRTLRRRVEAGVEARGRRSGPSGAVGAAGHGQRLRLPDDCCDTALSSWTLCTIPDLASALAEVQAGAQAGRDAPLRRARVGAGREGPACASARSEARSRQRFVGGCHLTRQIP